MEYTTKSLAQTEQLAKKFLAENADVHLVGLSGDLGSGKTAFVKGIAKELGVKKNITSPTFVIIKNYQFGKGKLIHIDAYRLVSNDDLESLGFSEMLSNKENTILIEWPERVYTDFPKEMKIINFEYINENERKITF